MKHIKRSVSLLLLVALLTALFAGVTFQASAKNTNKRDTLCMSLSTKAKAYYTGAYTYDKMSALSGGNTDCVASMNSALYKSLQSLMSSTQTDSVSYKSLTRYWPTTDNNILFYADQTGSGYNREHVWPKSRASFYQKNGGCDLHHLRPANQTLNSTRKNYTMGYVNGVINGCSTADYGGRTVLWYSAGNDLVEVRDNVKGDVARILLYVYCRWGQPNLYQNVKAENLPAFDSDDKDNNGKKVIESLDTLLKWCKSDPVDTWEMSRNDETQTIQGNRNVFIDYPEYAWLVFGQDIPNDMKTPSGEAAHAAPACDHVWDAGKVTTEPTCTAAGVKTYTCSKCGNTKTEEIPALGHIDENKDKLCDRCGAKLGEDPKPTGNKYVKAASLKDGDEVVLYNAGNGKALAGEMSSYYVAGVDVTPADNKITDPDAKLVWKVKKNDDSSFTFTQDGGNILGTDSRENNGKTFYNLYVDGEHKSTWTVEVANAETSTNYIYSSAMTGSYGKIYVEWYAKPLAFSAYDTSADRVTEKDFGFQFYVKTAGEEPQPSKDITVCFTNDVHGAYELYPYAATAMKGADLIVDAGDNIQGSVATTLTNGQCMVDLMKTVGYDVAVPGNHEFDYGFDRFLEIVNGDNTPYVSANLWDKTADKAVLDAYKIFTVGDKKVAVVGITTPETLVKSTPAFFQNAAGEYIYDFCNDTTGEKLYNIVQKAVDAAKAEGADYVIAVGHLGIDEQSEPWTSTSVIANTTGIDALIDGHSHSTFSNTAKNKDGKEIPVAQTGTQLKNVGKLTIAADGTITATLLPLYEVKTRVNETTGKEEKYNVYFYDTDPTVAAKVAEIKAEVDKVSKTVVARTEVDLTTLDPTTGKRAVRSAETNLGDLCADAYRDLLKTDVAFVNGGGVRANINKGDITYGQIIAVHPFGNTACKIEVTGEQLWTALEIGSAACPGESGGFLQVSGIEYTINTAIPTPARFNENKEFEKLEGEHRVTDVKVNGEPLDVNKTYTLGGHNYMLINGGDGYTVFRGSKILAQEVAIDNEVLIKYITGTLNGVVGADSIYANPTGAGRIKIVTSAHEHTYGDVKYTWTADGESFTCTAYKECTVSGCGDKLTATGTVTAKDDPAATCTAEGKRVFTATFTEDGFGTDTKTVDLPALGHVDEDKDNKCDRCGETLSTPATGARYEKVTEDQKDWSGTYLIVYEASETEAYVFSGVDAHGNLVTATFTDGKIPSSDAIKACEVTVAKEGDGYSFKLNGGANAGKYLTAYSGRNKIVFSDSAKALSIKVEDGVVKVLDGTAPFQFNKTNNDNGLWFRFFGKKSGGQSEIALYKLAN